MSSIKKHNISSKYILVCVFAVLFTFVLHEGAHYLMGESLGYDMVMNLNSASPIEGQAYSTEWHYQLVSAAGPVFTLFQAIVVFFIIKTTGQILWYPFLFVTFLMRSLAAGISAFVMANDEARISEWLGIGKMTLPIIVSLFLLFLTIKASRGKKLSWKFNIITYVIISGGITGLVFFNQHYLT